MKMFCFQWTTSAYAAVMEWIRVSVSVSPQEKFGLGIGVNGRRRTLVRCEPGLSMGSAALLRVAAAGRERTFVGVWCFDGAGSDGRDMVYGRIRGVGRS